MKFSELWLREWLDSDLGSSELQERLTMSGLEVDAAEPAALAFSGVVVARVEKIEPHPDADKLKVCEVNMGEAEPLTIVCGAANVQEGHLYPLATVGAVLPGDFRIKASKLRGVKSFGMLCSEKELGLAEEADGLFTLPADLEIGADIRGVLNLDDTIIELSLTPNRGDCLGVMGIARDAAALSGGTYTEVHIEPVPAAIESDIDIKLISPEDCPRYSGRLINSVNVKAETPLWMTERLRRSGIRGINPVVDITNYVMLELGQPMHAFAADKISGGIRVRRANAGESLTLLDGQSCDLTEETVVIADEQKALALAGIMGGLESSVQTDSKDIFLESAFFQPLSIIGKARQYGLHTDSSHRFERGVDYELPQRAIERATELILDICGGQPGPVQTEQDAEFLPVRDTVILREKRIQRVLGISLSQEAVEKILADLQMQTEKTNEGWKVTPPSFRFDIEIEADLIEELARVTGYDNIQGTVSGSELKMHPVNQAERYLAAARQCLIHRGYQEAITYSFIDPKLQTLFETDIEPVELSNPISSDMAVMRTSLIPGLVNALGYNLNRQQERIRLFESGLVFVQSNKDLQQVPHLAGLISGSVFNRNWSSKSRSVDFYDLKSDVINLIQAENLAGEIAFTPSQQKFCHPGQSADIYLADQYMGFIGALHPEIQHQLDLNNEVFIFELETSQNSFENQKKYVEYSRFPSVSRDISLLLEDKISAAEAIKIIRKSASDLLSNLELFDVYQGEGIEIGKKSLTFGLTFQGSSSTLTDSEVDSLVGDVLKALHVQIGATLRE